MRRASLEPIIVPLIIITLFLSSLGAWPALPAPGVAQAAGPDTGPSPATSQGVCRDVAKVMISDRARIERGQPAQVTGTILSASGAFSARPVDEPCDPAPAIAPVDVTAGGTIRVVLDGSPAVPCTWSLGNSGTGFALDYQPAMGRNFGPAQRLVAANLTCENEPETATHVEVTAEVPGPGRLQAHVGAPGGSGPLSGSCFEQSFSAQVDMLEVRPEAPAVDGMLLSSGDRLLTDDGGYAVLSFPPGTSVLVHSDVSFDYEPPGGGLAGDTVALENPARLNVWLQQYKDARLPLPINADYSAYRDATSLAAAKLAEGQDLCEGGLEVKLFLDSQQGQWTTDKLLKNAWTVFGVDEYDVLELVAKQFAKSLVPVVGVLGTIDDVADLVGIIYEEWQNQRASALFEPALAAWRDSRAWDKAQLQERLDALAQSRTAIEDEMRQAQDDAARTIQSEWDQFLLGNPLIWEKWRAEQNGKIIDWGPADIQRLQDFNARQRDIQAEAKRKIAELMYRRKAVSIEEKVLREYRAPLMEKGCDAFLKDLLTQPPVIGPCTDGASVLRLNSGSLRYVHQAGTAAGPQVRVGGRTIVPDGTEFVAETTENGGRVAVIEGRVTLYEPDGKPVQLEAGQQLEWPGDVLSDYDLAEDDGGPVAGVPLRHIPLDDETPLPSGRYGAQFANGRLPEDWLWHDPGDDVSVETPEPGTLRVSVPDGNELWRGSVTAPRLLHRVTGDFDLQAEASFETEASHFASTEFLLYAPGGYLGYLADQMDPGGATAHYRILGGAWQRNQGYNVLMSLPCTLPFWKLVECPAAPDGPVTLKLTRRGDVWRTYWSSDGQHWLLSGMQEIWAPDTVWVGWLFKRVVYDGLTDAPAVTTLRDVRLVNVPRGLAPPPEWDAIIPGQLVETRDGTPHLALDGSQPGSVRVQNGQRLEGDFDAVVRLDPEAWTRQPGQTRSFEVAAVAIDDLSRVYAAFNETEARRVFNTDLEINQGWYRYNEVPADADPATWLRISRRDGQVSTYTWSDCQWQPLSEFEDPLPDPLFLQLAVGNEWEATTPAPVAANFSLTYLLTGQQAAAAEWGAEGCAPALPGSSPAEEGPPPADTSAALPSAGDEPAAGGQTKSDHDIQDDFSTQKFAWCVAEDDIAISGYEDEAYFMHALQPNYRTLCFAPVGFFPTGGEFDARVPEEYRGGTFGLLCHYDPPGDFYSIEFDLDSRSLYLRQRLDGESLPLTDPEWIDLTHLKPSTGDTNHFRVTCDPDLIRVLVNGELEAELPLDPPAQPGDMALFVKGWESMGPRGYKVLFDNFRAWEEVP
jgi:hypothetical protein